MPFSSSHPQYEASTLLIIDSVSESRKKWIPRFLRNPFCRLYGGILHRSHVLFPFLFSFLYRFKIFFLVANGSPECVFVSVVRLDFSWFFLYFLF